MDMEKEIDLTKIPGVKGVISFFKKIFSRKLRHLSIPNHPLSSMPQCKPPLDLSKVKVKSRNYISTANHHCVCYTLTYKGVDREFRLLLEEQDNFFKKVERYKRELIKLVDG